MISKEELSGRIDNLNVEVRETYILISQLLGLPEVIMDEEKSVKLSKPLPRIDLSRQDCENLVRANLSINRLQELIDLYAEHFGEDDYEALSEHNRMLMESGIKVLTNYTHLGYGSNRGDSEE